MVQPTICWHINCYASKLMHIRLIASADTKADNKKFVRISQNANAMGKLSQMHRSDLGGASLFLDSVWTPNCLEPALKMHSAVVYNKNFIILRFS